MSEAGNKYNMLTAIEYVRTDSHYKKYWKFKCDCGDVSVSRLYRVVNGTIKSCGCLKRTSRTTHGMCKTPTYKSWYNMISRCTDTGNASYKNYGGRGISVCKRWKDSIHEFVKDVGVRPSRDYSIDRIDNSGNYEPGNCKWSTNSEQSNNKRNNNYINYNSETITITMFSEICNVSHSSILYHIRRGKTPEEIKVYFDNKRNN